MSQILTHPTNGSSGLSFNFAESNILDSTARLAHTVLGSTDVHEWRTVRYSAYAWLEYMDPANQICTAQGSWDVWMSGRSKAICLSLLFSASHLSVSVIRYYQSSSNAAAAGAPTRRFPYHHIHGISILPLRLARFVLSSPLIYYALVGWFVRPEMGDIRNQSKANYSKPNLNTGSDYLEKFRSAIPIRTTPKALITNSGKGSQPRIPNLFARIHTDSPSKTERRWKSSDHGRP